jgi:putative transposase
MRKSFRYRIYPTKSQEAALDKQLQMCRGLYNMALDQRIWAYRTQQIGISVFEQMRQLTEMKAEFSEFTQIHVHVLQNTLKKLDKAYSRFFGGAGFPRFKSKDRFRTLQFNNTGFRLLDNKLRISKVGDIKIKLSRPVDGMIKTLAVTRNSSNQWFACFSCIVDMPTIVRRTGDTEIGIDLGLEKFATLSDGSMVPNPRHQRKNAEALARRQQSLARKKKGSKSRSKTKILAAKSYLKVSNQRRDFHFKLSKHLVSNYDRIFHEKLNIKNMSRSEVGTVSEPNLNSAQKSGLNKSILDAGWGQFLDILRFKAENAGVEVVSVNPSFTSQTCSDCGTVAKKDLSTRIHSCECGLEIDRDWNAAINILRLGQSRVEVS